MNEQPPPAADRPSQSADTERREAARQADAPALVLNQHQVDALVALRACAAAEGALFLVPGSGDRTVGLLNILDYCLVFGRPPQQETHRNTKPKHPFEAPGVNPYRPL